MNRVDRHGQRLGVFRLVGLLGQGGQGQVYRAFDTERGRTVALKILDGADNDLARIRREFRALEGIAHPNIVPFYELGRHADTTYYTMQLVEGAPLLDGPTTRTLALADADERDLDLRSRSGPADDDPERWLLGLVRALERMHRSGLLHLDIKPSNLLLARDGTLLLVDFGLATRFDAATSRAPAPSQISIGFSSPEHRRQDPVSPASDWFSVGATLFCALVGRPPAEELADDAARVASLGDLGALCARLLSSDPSDRAGPAEIRRALGEPETRSEEQSDPEGRRTRSRPRAALRLKEIPSDERDHRIGIFDLEEPIEEHESVAAQRHIEPASLELRARCRQWESVPFGVLSDLILESPLRSRLSQVDTPSLVRMLLANNVDESTGLRPSREHLRLAAREFIGLLGAGATGARPLIQIDQFQWCDLDSLVLLMDALALSKDIRFDLVLTHRDHASQNPALKRLRRWLLSKPPGVAHREFEPPVEEPGLGDRIELPELTDSEETYLELCTLAGTRVSQHEIRLALSDPTPEIEVLRSLRSKGLVTSSGPRLSDHVEVPESVMARVRPRIPLARARRLHLRLARSARRSPHGSPASLAHHYSNAGLPLLAQRHLVASGRAARDAYAFDRASAFFQSALQTTTSPAAERAALWAEAAYVLTQCGRGREAADAWLEAASGSDGESAKEYRLAAAEMLLTSGHYSEGRALLRELASDYGVRYPRTQAQALRRAAVGLIRESLLLGHNASGSRRNALAFSRSRFCSAAFQGLMPVDPTRAAVFATEGIRWSRKSGDDFALAGSILSLASGVLSPSGPRMRAWGFRMLEAAQRLAGGEASGALLARVEIARSTMAFWEGEWKSALRLANSARRLLGSSRIERAFDRNVLDLVRTRALEEIGHWEQANASTSEMYADALERDDAYAAVTARLNLGMLALAHGDVATARSWADQALDQWPGKGMQVQHLYALRVHAYADLCEGRPVSAWDRLQSNWPAIQKGFHLRVSAGRVDVFMLRGRIAARMLRDTSDSARWAKEVEEAIAVLDRVKRRDARAHAALLRASLVDHTDGPDTAQSREAIGRAETLYRQVDMGALADACQYFTDPDPSVRSRRKTGLEHGGIGDVDLWLRGFVPLGP